MVSYLVPSMQSTSWNDEHYSHCLNRKPPCNEGTFRRWTYKHWKFWFNEVCRKTHSVASRSTADKMLSLIHRCWLSSLWKAILFSNLELDWLYWKQSVDVNPVIELITQYMLRSVVFPSLLSATHYLMNPNIRCVLSETRHWRNIYFTLENWYTFFNYDLCFNFLL